MKGVLNVPVEEALIVGPLLVGLFSHQYWKRKEPSVFQVFGVILVGFFSVACYTHISGDVNIGYAIGMARQVVGLWLASLLASIFIYRNSPWHPLAEFPGPVLARTTQIWWFYHNYHAKPRFLLQNLHKKYGDFVRIGPNELSVQNVDAMMPIHGANGWPKSISFEKGLLTSAPEPHMASLQAQIHHKPHSLRRRQGWDKAFSATSMKHYEKSVWKRAQQFLYRLAEQKGQPVNFSKWIGCFVYEAMSDVAFGRGFDFLKRGSDYVGIVQALVDAHFAHGLCDAMLWIKPIMERIPANDSFTTVLNFAAERFTERYERGPNPEIKDAFSYLIADHGKGIPPLTPYQLSRESMLIISGGSDTSRGALTYTLFELARHPEAYAKLRAELDRMFKDKELNFDDLEHAEYLNGCIQEGMRLEPPISAMKRDSPGTTLLGKYIPAGTPVRVANYAMCHDSRYFSPQPDVYRPERWVNPDAEQAMVKLASQPFLTGPYACIGRVLALKELRITLASICMSFDISYAPNFDPNKFLDTIYDRFTTDAATDLWLVMTPRKDGKNYHFADDDTCWFEDGVETGVVPQVDPVS